MTTVSKQTVRVGPQGHLIAEGHKIGGSDRNHILQKAQNESTGQIIWNLLKNEIKSAFNKESSQDKQNKVVDGNKQQINSKGQAIMDP